MKMKEYLVPTLFVLHAMYQKIVERSLHQKLDDILSNFEKHRTFHAEQIALLRAENDQLLEKISQTVSVEMPVPVLVSKSWLSIESTSDLIWPTLAITVIVGVILLYFFKTGGGDKSVESSVLDTYQSGFRSISSPDRLPPLDGGLDLTNPNSLIGTCLEGRALSGSSYDATEDAVMSPKSVGDESCSLVNVGEFKETVTTLSISDLL